MDLNSVIEEEVRLLTIGATDEAVYDENYMNVRVDEIGEATITVTSVGKAINYRGATRTLDKRVYLTLRSWARQRKIRDNLDLFDIERISSCHILDDPVSRFGLDSFQLLDSIPYFNKRLTAVFRCATQYKKNAEQGIKPDLLTTFLDYVGLFMKFRTERIDVNLCKELTEIQEIESSSRSRFYAAARYLIKKEKTLKPNDVLDFSSIHVPEFVVVDKLGRGLFKHAYLARHKYTGSYHALLEINPESRGFKLYQRLYPNKTDTQILRVIQRDEFSATQLRQKVASPHVALMDLPRKGKHSDSEFYYIPTAPYKQTLESKLEDGALQVKIAIKYFGEICLALSACRDASIVHKDLKPANIGITKNGSILLCDFGRVDTFTGDNPHYRYPLHLKPPELVIAPYSETDINFTTEMNAWTAGAIFYQMLTGKTLFDRPELRADSDTDEYRNQNDLVNAAILAFRWKTSNQRKEVKSLLGSSRNAVYALESLDFCLSPHPTKRNFGISAGICMIRGIGSPYDTKRRRATWLEIDDVIQNRHIDD